MTNYKYTGTLQFKQFKPSPMINQKILSSANKKIGYICRIYITGLITYTSKNVKYPRKDLFIDLKIS